MYQTKIKELAEGAVKGTCIPTELLNTCSFAFVIIGKRVITGTKIQYNVIQAKRPDM